MERFKNKLYYVPVSLGVVAVAELLQNQATRSVGSNLLGLGNGTIHACKL